MTTHTSDASVKPRSALMDGRATLTMVVSSTIISTPRHSTMRASQRLRSSRVWGMDAIPGGQLFIWPPLIIHAVPWRSTSTPKISAQKVFCSGMVTWPPSASALKMRCASETVG
ncbi:Uncharacterised protein [Bordetella pertussis]|nr:Uncharacterised protein [Bordetella pertussis]CFP65072.1 Uncharacterised protein [Bordetella pertussis]CPM59438.1 Uncharacterised protein [Bordetella pertussis]